MLNIKIESWTLGIFATISVVLCVIYRLIVPSLPMQGLLEMILPVSTWLTVGGFSLGLIERLLYGTYAGRAFVPSYNFSTHQWSIASTH